VLLFGLIAIGGCVSVRTTGAASIQDMQAEDAYKAVYAEQMTRVRTDNVAFQPTSSSPGVCNKGGSQQGCFDADAVMIQDFKATQNALAATGGATALRRGGRASKGSDRRGHSRFGASQQSDRRAR
jgi:hypothetical protein